MFEFPSVTCNARLQSFAPFSDCSGQSLADQARPLLDALQQFFHVHDLVLVNAVLQSLSHRIVNRIEIRTVECSYREREIQSSVVLHVPEPRSARKWSRPPTQNICPKFHEG